MSKKIVVKVEVHDNKDKQKAMKAVSALVGIDALSLDMKSRKMTVIGTVDPVNVVSKLRKASYASAIEAVGPAKEPEKKEEPKKEEPKKEEPKKEGEGDKKEGEKKEGEGEKKEGDAKKDGEGEKKEGDADKKEGEGKDDSKKDGEEAKKAPPPPPTAEQIVAELMNQYRSYYPYHPHPPYMYHPPPPQYFVQSMEENPNSCAIL